MLLVSRLAQCGVTFGTARCFVLTAFTCTRVCVDVMLGKKQAVSALSWELKLWEWRLSEEWLTAPWSKTIILPSPSASPAVCSQFLTPVFVSLVFLVSETWAQRCLDNKRVNGGFACFLRVSLHHVMSVSFLWVFFFCELDNVCRVKMWIWLF